MGIIYEIRGPNCSPKALKNVSSNIILPAYLPLCTSKDARTLKRCLHNKCIPQRPSCTPLYLDIRHATLTNNVQIEPFRIALRLKLRQTNVLSFLKCLRRCNRDSMLHRIVQSLTVGWTDMSFLLLTSCDDIWESDEAHSFNCSALMDRKCFAEHIMYICE